MYLEKNKLINTKNKNLITFLKTKSLIIIFTIILNSLINYLMIVTYPLIGCNTEIPGSII